MAAESRTAARGRSAGQDLPRDCQGYERLAQLIEADRERLRTLSRQIESCMAIVTTTYRYKRPPRKRKAVALDRHRE